MIKKILIFNLIILNALLAQYSPNSFKIDNNRLNKAEGEAPIGNTIGDMVVTKKIIWVATGQGISKSLDNGKTWKHVNISKFQGARIVSLGYHKNIVWVATFRNTPSNVRAGDGIWFSQDEGNTWVHIRQPLDEITDTTITYGINKLKAQPVIVKEQSVIYDISFTNDEIWIASWASGIKKCNIAELIKNPQMKWQRVVLPPDKLNSISPEDSLSFSLRVSKGKPGDEENLNHLGFSILAVNDNLIFAGTAGGLNKSTDGGLSWEKYTNTNQDNPISGNWVVGLAYNTFNNSIWAATWRADGKNEFNAVSFSYDNCNNWQTNLSEIKASNFAFKFNEAIAATDEGVFRTNNKGQTWISSVSIIDAKTGSAIYPKFFQSAATLQNPDETVDIWLGSSEGLAVIREKFASAMWDGDWLVLKTSAKLSSSDETYSAPNPYYPNDNNPLKIVYSTNNKEAKVTIRIFDFGMNLIKTLTQNAVISGNMLESYWNGRDEAGKVLPNGVYFYRVDVDGNEPLFNKIMILK